MFTVDTTITDLKAKEKSMLKVLFSMNTHQVATPEMNLEEVRSYVIFCREGGGRISAYIGLHLLDTDRRLFYPHSANPFPEKDMDAVDEEARGFAEGLGAMLDEIDITKMSPEERTHWIDDQAIFNITKQTEAKPAEQTAPPAARSLEEPAAPASRPQETAAPAVPEAAASITPPSPAAQPEGTAAPAIPESAASVTPPSPAAQPEGTAAPPVPGSAASVAKAASVVQAEPVTELEGAAATAIPMHTIPAPPAPEPSPQPSVQQKPPKKPVAVPAKVAHQDSAKRAEDIIQRAIKAGVVKAPKPQLNKEILGTNGIVSRDKEALARLLSSF